LELDDAAVWREKTRHASRLIGRRVLLEIA